MKRIVVLTALSFAAISGCTCLNLDVQRAYACAPDGGTGQCPADGVCGLEGFCHARGDEQPWQCTDDTHCEGDWRCGLEGVCHARGDEQPWQCVTDEHCEGTWRCGPEGVCLNPAAEALVPAQATSLTAVARTSPLPPGLPDAVTGSGYEAFFYGPTCSTNPAETDGGYHLGYSGALTSTVIKNGELTKVLFWTDRWTLPDGGAPRAVDCGTLATLQHFQVLQHVVPGETVEAYEHEHETWTLQRDGSLCRYTLTPEVELVRECDGGFEIVPDGGPLTLRGSEPPGRYLLGLQREHYQIYDLDTSQRVGGPLQVHGADGGAVPIHDLVIFPNGFSGPMTLLAATRLGPFARTLDGSAIEPAGTINVGGWQPVLDGANVCEPMGGPGTSFPLRYGFSSDDLGRLILEIVSRAEEPDGGFLETIHLVTTGPDPSPIAGCPKLLSPQGDEPFAPLIRGCYPCPQNSRLLWHRTRAESPSPRVPVFGLSPVKLEARCSNPAGGDDLVAVDASGSCSPWGFGKEGMDPVEIARPTGARFERPLKVNRVALSTPWVADGFGHVWWARFAWEFSPWFLDAAPSFFFEGASGEVTGVVLPRVYEMLNDAPVIASRSRAFDEGPLGYAAASYGNYTFDFGAGTVPALAVFNQPKNFVLIEVERTGEAPVKSVVEVLAPDQRPGTRPYRAHLRWAPDVDLGPPYHGEVATTSEGAKIAVLTSGDSVFAADITASVAAPLPTSELAFEELYATPVPSVKFTAVNRTPVQSLVTLAPPPPGAAPRYVEGYLLQSSRVFRFRAANANVWRTEEIVLEDESEPLSVFADGVRGRVGMKNGRVYSLPTRFALSAELPAAAQPVTQYHAWCGHLVASARDGIYRLVANGTAVAQWQRLPLPDGDYDGSRVHGSQGTLRVVSRVGDAFDVTGFECRAPAQ